MQVLKDEEEAENAKTGGFGKKKKSGKKSKKNPFGGASPDHSRSASLEAEREYTGKLNHAKPQEEEPECELNLSFSGGYVPNTDLSRVDKGLGNP